MSKWISVHSRLPELGKIVWLAIYSDRKWIVAKGGRIDRNESVEPDEVRALWEFFSDVLGESWDICYWQPESKRKPQPPAYIPKSENGDMSDIKSEVESQQPPQKSVWLPCTQPPEKENELVIVVGPRNDDDDNNADPMLCIYQRYRLFDNTLVQEWTCKKGGEVNWYSFDPVPGALWTKFPGRNEGVAQ